MTAPLGCREHARRWTAAASWHQWTRPETPLIEARLRERLATPTEGTEGAP